MGFVVLASHDSARADEPAKLCGPIPELRILATPKHQDDRSRPAVGLHVSRAGARKSSELTRAEISDDGIIENIEPTAADSLIEKLRASIGKP